jgi:hypothetical protein
MVGQVTTVSATAASKVTTITPVASTGVQTGQTITLSGITPTAMNVSLVVTSVSTSAPYTITANATTAWGATAPSYSAGGAILTLAGVVGTVSSAVTDAPVGANPPTATFTLAAAPNVAIGQIVSITGLTDNTALNISGKVTAVGALSITVAANPAKAQPSGTSAGGGFVTLSNTAVADSGTKSYTTVNYWAQDDLNNATEVARDSNGAIASGSPVVTSLENNISRWCTTCHTRLLAGSGSYKTALTAGGATDTMYAFRHRSDANTNGAAANKAMGDSPNCLTCHVSHGSNASMAGQYSGAVGNPDGTTPSTPDSFLLRVDNRGTCQMCHNK